MAIQYCTEIEWQFMNYIVACQGAGVSIKPVTRTPTRHTLGPFSLLNRWTIPDITSEHVWRLTCMVGRPQLSSPPFNCPHATETSEPYVRWHATIYIFQMRKISRIC